MPIKLILAGVDGTLVTHEKVLTRRAIDSVQALRSSGIERHGPPVDREERTASAMISTRLQAAKMTYPGDFSRSG